MQRMHRIILRLFYDICTSQNKCVCCIYMKDLPTLIDEFLEYLEIEKNCSKLTIRDYRHYLEVFKKWYIDNIPSKSLEKLDLSDIRRYRVFLSNKTNEKGEGLARVTQNYYVIALRSFLSYLIKNDYKT